MPFVDTRDRFNIALKNMIMIIDLLPFILFR